MSEELGARARVLEEGGAEMWERFMSELRQQHLDALADSKDRGPEPGGLSVAATLQAAYEEVVARDANG